MTTECLKYLSEVLNTLIPYEFMQWTGKVKYPYWVGEYTEVIPVQEDGLQESTFILTGTTKGSWLELEKAKDKIQNKFPSIDGHGTTLDDGSGVVIFFSNSFPVPTGQDDLKRMQINLSIKQWKG